MDCKEAQVLLIPHIMGDLDPDSRQCRELEAHLLSCQACAEEYENSKWVVEFIQEHKILFAEAFETIDKKRAAEQEEIKRSWQAIQAKLVKIKAQEKRAELRRVLWRATAAAACVVIGISAWLVLSNSKMLEKPAPRQVASVPAPSIKIELLSGTGNVIISAGTEIKTTASEMKILIINDKHRMVLNSDTALSIEPLIDYERVVCMVKLVSGEIFTHVQHDGNSFVVGTAHGRAVITGTTFDIKATNHNTMLVVTDGNVRFESEKGFVEVTAGHTSEIVAQSAPTKPVSCSTAELTAWATGHELKTALAKIGSFSDAYDLSGLWLSAMSSPINLENIDYEDWIEEKREWFKREFPWIFGLQSALAKEGIEVDYPELLVNSGDIWQFIYPETSPQQIPILCLGPLLTTASGYGFDKQWLLENVPSAKFAIIEPDTMQDRFIGLKAFQKWTQSLEGAQQPCCDTLDAELLLYPLHAGTYLANTKTLAYLFIDKNKHTITAESEADVLALLQSEVNTANKLVGCVISLLGASADQPCDKAEYQQLVSDIVEHIKVIMDVEERISAYKADRGKEVLPMGR